MDWNDLRFFIALAREGSLAGAARRLGVEHTTVSRRVAALEKQLAVKLFERTHKGFQLTAEGVEVSEFAYRIEDEAFGIERLASADQAVHGLVRISAPPAVASYYLTPRLASFHQRWGNVQVELAGDRRSVNLSRREADIAIRLSAPGGGSMVARRVGAIAHALYGAHAYLERTAVGEREYVGYDEALDHVRPQQWLFALARGRPLVFRSSELACLHQAVVAGIGLGVLPRFIGDQDSRLARVPVDNAASATHEVWLLLHPDLRRSRRVRAVVDYLAEAFRADLAVLDPEPADAAGGAAP
ncbi:MAG TPA: LysR family transcriptional regulator [Steroidobacter sp.]|nr:LysR family transcriptional regulator [Steroidobacter sp.]